TFSSNPRLIHSQLIRWLLNGTATQWPSHFRPLAMVGAIRSAQLPFLATASTLLVNPVWHHFWICTPLICAAPGRLSDCTRDLSTVAALAPPPPATASLIIL